MDVRREGRILACSALVWLGCVREPPREASGAPAVAAVAVSAAQRPSAPASAAPAPPLDGSLVDSPAPVAPADADSSTTPGESHATTGDSPWMGMTQAEVKASLAGSERAKVLLSGDPVLTVRGATWLVEWEPGGCSDWTMLLTLHFARGRVVHVEEEHRHRYTGKECR